VFSSGVVKPGRDLSEDSDGTAWICPTPGAPGKGLELVVTHRGKVRYQIAGGSGGVLAWTWKEFPGSLDSVFEKAGYAVRDEAELLEVGRAIDGVRSGPKGTILEGQSKVLKVLEADYLYGRCTEGMKSKAAGKARSCGAVR